MAVVPDNEADLSATAASSDLVAFGCVTSYVGGHATVLVRGEVDLATGPVLLREVLATLALPVAGVTIDLGYVSFLDSSGVSALNAARQAAADVGVVFALDAIPLNVRRVLEVTGMVSLFHVSENGARMVPGPD